MYLKLSVAGHLTIFLDVHPRPVLVDTPSADFTGRGAWHASACDPDRGVWRVHDAARLGGWTLFVWGHAVTWFLVNDCVKLLAYRIFDAAKSDFTSEGTHGMRPAPSGA